MNKINRGGFLEEHNEIIRKFEVSGKISTTHFKKSHIIDIMKALGFREICVEEKNDSQKKSKGRRKS